MKNYTSLTCLETKIVHPTKFYGRFELGYFATGQALTVANTLRRTLLSQLPGVSMTLVQIENVLHEYENILGIQECALDIVLNLKQIILTSEFEVFSPQIGFLNVKGPGIVRAGDLKLPFFISCVNPYQYIATLTEQGELNMTVLINSGKNYLNHTPSSNSYESRVKLLQQRDDKNNKTYKGLDMIYYNWQQQRNIPINEKFFSVANFIQSKLAEKLLVRQPAIAQSGFLKTDSLKTKPRFQKLTGLKTKLTRVFNKKPRLIIKPDLIRDQNKQKSKSKTPAVTKKIEPGYLTINALFSPVTKANYTIQTNNDRQKGELICFEVWTNGSIDPRRAIHRSVKSLIKLFLPLQQTKQRMIQKKSGVKKPKQKNPFLKNRNQNEFGAFAGAPEELQNQMD